MVKQELQNYEIYFRSDTGPEQITCSWSFKFDVTVVAPLFETVNFQLYQKEILCSQQNYAVNQLFEVNPRFTHGNEWGKVRSQKEFLNCAGNLAVTGVLTSQENLIYAWFIIDD